MGSKFTIIGDVRACAVRTGLYETMGSCIMLTTNFLLWTET